ncbi:hypothetical protein G6F56_014658 [Rhizopus delemar]|nr:hypothetical protein G6F56_014658 [Rhizopus delemar]
MGACCRGCVAGPQLGGMADVGCQHRPAARLPAEAGTGARCIAGAAAHAGNRDAGNGTGTRAGGSPVA